MKRSPLWSGLAPLMLAMALLVFAIDQAHKWWMLHVFGIGQAGRVALTSFFDLVLVWNQGISYGLFRTHAQEVLIVVSLVVTGGLWIWACRSRSALSVAATGLVIGGALSNALDRAIYGAVADFFHFHVGSFSWYIFNIADVAIVAGVALLLYDSWIGGRAEARHGNA